MDVAPVSYQILSFGVILRTFREGALVTNGMFEGMAVFITPALRRVHASRPSTFPVAALYILVRGHCMYLNEMLPECSNVLLTWVWAVFDFTKPRDSGDGKVRRDWNGLIIDSGRCGHGSESVLNKVHPPSLSLMLVRGQRWNLGMVVASEVSDIRLYLALMD
ncbi:hypothetical protein B0H34DRAFT_114940 [Crassisporium funariophilum]|nr:hypothetical protein B0H34DRAFT_114940 [Crassisporium funariophilum]